MKEELIEAYSTLKKNNIEPKTPTNTFNVNFVDGAFFEAVGDYETQYEVIMWDEDSGNVIHNTIITNNMWTRTSVKYFVNWHIEVFDLSTNEKVFDHLYDAFEQRVYIHLDSSAIGDTLAWFPYVEEFRKQHKCEVIVSTFHNDWFEKTYPELEFVAPGTNQNNLYAMYGIGWYYNEDHTVDIYRNPTDYKPQPLQKTATDALGLEYKEIKPEIDFPAYPKPHTSKYVVIAPHASAHAKYWNREGGWQEIIDYLISKGYRVMMITQELATDAWHNSKLGGPLKNIVDETGDQPIKTRMHQILHADLFIGVGSGLSWLSWAIETPTILISGFSEDYTEFQDCERINAPEDKCSGCFNRSRLNAGDWEWCPDHKDTDRHYECTKSITPETVKKSIDKLLK